MQFRLIAKRKDGEKCIFNQKNISQTCCLFLGLFLKIISKYFYLLWGHRPQLPQTCKIVSEFAVETKIKQKVFEEKEPICQA